MKKKILIGAGSAVGLLLIVYFGFTIYFANHYLWHTKVGTIDCGGKSAQYAVDRNVTIGKSYGLVITDRKGNTFPITGTDFDYQYVPKGEEEKILKSQNPFTWPASIWSSQEYELESSVTYDKEAFEALVENTDIFNEDYITPPVDAYIEIGEDDYQVVPEDMGTTPSREGLFAKLHEALENEASEVTLTDDCYENPQITTESSKITDAKAKLDSYTASTIHYEIDGVDENFSKKDILAVLDINDDGMPSVNDDKLAKYVQHLASTYNTYGDKREFKTSSGDTITVGGGDYGWVISKSNELAQIKEDLEGGQAVSREPVYEQTAKQSCLDDIGNTYIEIDYTKQHMWYYKDGSLVLESDIVSGNLSSSNGSVDGVYKIVYKERNATLVGENYSTPVNCFMPFAYNIGFHDAGWRSSFGGDIYKTSGSHGCINMPPEAAQKLYEIVEKGTPVVAYYREPVVLTNNAAKMSNAYSYVAPDTAN